MAWFWTDDLARALVENDLVSADAVSDWIVRPVAVTGPDGADPVAVGRHTLGIERESA
jgi:hypothetical protein